MGSPEQQSPSNRDSQSSSSLVKEIKIYCKVIKVVEMKVKRSETIKRLKVTLCKEEQVSEKFQELFLSGDRLQDGQTLTDYGINNDSILHLVIRSLAVMKVFVRIPSKQKTITLEVKTWDTIQNMKTMIQTEEGIQSNQFSLYFNGERLNDDSILASLNIERESTLHLVFNRGDVLSICLKTETEGIARVKVRLLHTVEDVKVMFQSLSDVPGHYYPPSYRISYEGQDLEGCKTLAYYNIKEESVLEIFPLIEIFVATLDGQILDFIVEPGHTIRDLMEKIFQKVGLPVNDQAILFQGENLKKERNFASIRIKKGDVLLLWAGMRR